MVKSSIFPAQSRYPEVIIFSKTDWDSDGEIKFSNIFSRCSCHHLKKLWLEIVSLQRTHCTNVMTNWPRNSLCTQETQPQTASENFWLLFCSFYLRNNFTYLSPIDSWKYHMWANMDKDQVTLFLILQLNSLHKSRSCAVWMPLMKV